MTAKVGHFQDGKFNELASGSEEYCRGFLDGYTPTKDIGNQIAAEIGQMTDEEVEANVLRFFPPSRDGVTDEITRVLKKHGREDVPTYLKEIAYLRGLLGEAYRELSTIEAATLVPGGQSEIDGLLDLVQRIKEEIR